MAPAGRMVDLSKKISVKNNSDFEIATFFHHLYGKGNSVANSKLELFLTEWSRSYIVFALARTAFSSNVYRF